MAECTMIIPSENGGRGLYSGHGSPEGVVTAEPGSLYTDLDSGQLYVKVSGTGNTGWQ